MAYEISQLKESIWRAALDSDCWAEVIVQLEELTGGVTGTIFTPFCAGAGMIWSAPTATAAYIKAYADGGYMEKDLLRHALYRRLPLESLIYSWDDLISRTVLEGSEFYKDIVQPHGVTDGVGLVVRGTGEETIVMTSFGESWSQGEIMSHKKLLHDLQPTLSGAAEAHWRLMHAEQSAAVSRYALDQLALGIIWLGKNGKVIEANKTALEILRIGDGLKIRKGVLSAVVAAEEQELLRQIGAVETAAPAQADHILRISRMTGGRPYSILLTPAAINIGNLVNGNIKVIAFITDPGAVPDVAGERLGKLYGLSKTEAALAQALALGETIESVCKRRGVSPNTVRTQLKTMMAKLGVDRQSDVIRAVMSLSAIRSPIK